MEPVAPMSREVTLEVLQGLLAEAIAHTPELEEQFMSGDTDPAIEAGSKQFEEFLRETGLDQDALIEYVAADASKTIAMMSIMVGPIVTDDMINPFFQSQLVQGILMGWHLRKWCEERSTNG